MAVDRHGCREYDKPRTGRGLGFSALLIDLLALSGNEIAELSAVGRMMAA